MATSEVKTRPPAGPSKSLLERWGDSTSLASSDRTAAHLSESKRWEGKPPEIDEALLERSVSFLHRAESPSFRRTDGAIDEIPAKAGDSVDERDDSTVEMDLDDVGEPSESFLSTDQEEPKGEKEATKKEDTKNGAVKAKRDRDGALKMDLSFHFIDRVDGLSLLASRYGPSLRSLNLSCNNLSSLLADDLPFEDHTSTSEPPSDVATTETDGAKPADPMTIMRPLSRLASLTELRLYANSIRGIQGLEGCVRLTHLDMDDNAIESISGLDTLINLVSLNLSRNRLTYIDGLGKLLKLRHLFISGNLIAQVEGLQPLRRLETLHLDANCLGEHKPVDAFAFANLANVTELDISHNPLGQPIPCPPVEQPPTETSTSPSVRTRMVARGSIRDLLSSLRAQKSGNEAASRSVSTLSGQLQRTNVSAGGAALTWTGKATRVRVKPPPILFLDHLSKLQTLFLESCCLSDHDLRAFPLLSELTQLSLARNSLDGGVLTVLADRTPNVEILDLSHNMLRDVESLDTLKTLARLCELRLEGNPLSPSKDALPITNAAPHPAIEAPPSSDHPHVSSADSESLMAVLARLPHLEYLDDEPLDEAASSAFSAFHTTMRSPSQPLDDGRRPASSATLQLRDGGEADDYGGESLAISPFTAGEANTYDALVATAQRSVASEVDMSLARLAPSVSTPDSSPSILPLPISGPPSRLSLPPLASRAEMHHITSMCREGDRDSSTMEVDVATERAALSRLRMKKTMTERDLDDWQARAAEHIDKHGAAINRLFDRSHEDLESLRANLRKRVEVLNGP
ncbi:unnamed protein product [Vitrella brassicaformis CCMP3155]|uniref:Protein phosphatase 1 regulatory subunit 7 n=3 Tax=Vitrella brassicaformis TaxID=1169539 RepID=A0A0G4EN28_VITBC|nr:unnamed protein product [Vitrella brassicaformis CCMP3155]|eukprot:CEL98400.1 unnamed protein product [Vitrella brassicaformis CCMP3155]